ncbi:MAG: hypothetical protein GY862_12830 [Gammaproteobacteria bacterium]|nr:hypothetical protein [Gammaproteobacteria bacterium]
MCAIIYLFIQYQACRLLVFDRINVKEGLPDARQRGALNAGSARSAGTRKPRAGALRGTSRLCAPRCIPSSFPGCRMPDSAER